MTSRGIVSAAAFSGDGSALTGVATAASLNNESQRAQTAESALTSALNAEVGRQQASQASLQAQINAVAASVPKQLYGRITFNNSAKSSASFPAGTFSSAPICVVSPTSLPPNNVSYFVSTTATAIILTISANSTISYNFYCGGNP